MRVLVIVVVALLATSGDVRAEPAQERRVDEFAVISGVLVGGSFIEQRGCTTKRDRFIGCTHFLIGKQEGGTMKGNLVLDLYASSGVVLHHGRFDVTPSFGFSMLSTVVFLGCVVISPVVGEFPDPRVMYSLFPFEVTGNVALGYRVAAKGRFRARAELAVRAHVPLFTDSVFELPSPHGLGVTFGLGAGF